MSKRIELTKGYYAIVDEKDFDWLNKLRWCAKESLGNKIYAINRRNGIVIYMHKIILNVPEGKHGDHINGDTLDNRRSNLRICTHQQNLCNQKLSSANTSGYKGVSWSKENRKWHSYIKVRQKRIHLGLFKQKIDAAKAYNDAAIKYFGEFAKLNEI